MYIKFNNFIIILFLFALSLSVSLSFSSIKNAYADNISQLKTPPSANTYFYAGTIVSINSSSIKLYNGVTCFINSSTSCLAVQNGMMTMNNNAANMTKTSCSTLKKGETVSITASKNAGGQLIAVKIKPVFY